MINYKVVKEINKNWFDYDKLNAQCQLDNYGKIYIDEYGDPIDNEYDMEEIISTQ